MPLEGRLMQQLANSWTATIATPVTKLRGKNYKKEIQLKAEKSRETIVVGSWPYIIAMNSEIKYIFPMNIDMDSPIFHEST